VKRKPSGSGSALWDRIRTGAFGGAVFGGLLLGVGLIRTVVALVAGGEVSTSPVRDLALASLYVAGFAFAGGSIGALWPLRTTLLGAYALGYLGAGIVSAVCGIIVMQIEGDDDPVAFAFVVAS
jgi:hypothetical protein